MLRIKPAGTGDLREGLLVNHPPIPRFTPSPGGGIRGVCREGAQLGPGAEFPHTTSPTFHGAGASPSRSILSTLGALEPAPSPTEAPPPGGGGRRSKCKGSRCWSLSFIFGDGGGRRVGSGGMFGEPPRALSSVWGGMGLGTRTGAWAKGSGVGWL